MSDLKMLFCSNWALALLIDWRLIADELVFKLSSVISLLHITVPNAYERQPVSVSAAGGRPNCQQLTLSTHKRPNISFSVIRPGYSLVTTACKRCETWIAERALEIASGNLNRNSTRVLTRVYSFE